MWSKKPIPLIVRENDGTQRRIFAQFDPTYHSEKGRHTDASKLMGGNRHGTSAEQRVTLDLADDYHQIITEAVYNYSKDETGKETETHRGVRQWHYFVNDILFQEQNSDELTPYRISINIKEKGNENFVYSFSAEKSQKGLSTRRTLHADDTSAIDSEGNAQPTVSIDYMSSGVKQNVSTTDKGERYSVSDTIRDMIDENADMPSAEVGAVPVVNTSPLC